MWGWLTASGLTQAASGGHFLALKKQQPLKIYCLMADANLTCFPLGVSPTTQTGPQASHCLPEEGPKGSLSKRLVIGVGGQAEQGTLRCTSALPQLN